MTNEEAKNLLKGMKDNNSVLARKSKDVERIAAMELINSALTIAIEAIEDSDTHVDLYEKATRKVLDDYLAPELVKKIIKAITLEYCRLVSE